MLEELINYLGSFSRPPVEVRFQSRDAVLHGVVRNVLYKRDGLYTRHFEPLSAAYVLAPDDIITSQHIASRLLKLRPITLVCAGGQALLFAAHEPVQLVLILLIAIRTDQRVSFQLWSLIEKIPLLHRAPLGLPSRMLFTAREGKLLERVGVL